MSLNPELQVSLDMAVGEVLSLLTGLDLHYVPELDRYRAITHHLNRALRANALEAEWSYYSSLENVGVASQGVAAMAMRSTVRPRIINDDAVQLHDEHDHPVLWAYWLPRDALSKYAHRAGLWAAHTRNLLMFSRPFTRGEAGLKVMVPVMREPLSFVVPATLENIESLDPNDIPGNNGMTSEEIREQLLDFSYPDLIIYRAAWLYAMTDPVMQPRAQQLEAMYKDLMYQLIERDERNTDSPYLNSWAVPVENSIHGPDMMHHYHPHADERR